MAGIAFALRALKHITPLTRSSTITATRRWCSNLPSTPAPWLRVWTDMNATLFIGFDNFYNIVDKRLVKLDMFDAYRFGNNVLCVGSSRGTLAFIGQNGRFYVAFPYGGGGYKCRCRNPDSLIRFYAKLGYVEKSISIPGKNPIPYVNYIETVLCYPGHHPENPTPNNYHDFYVHWPDEWTRYPNLFHKDDPPIVYYQKTNTVYKLSCYGNEYGPWDVELWDTSDERINVTSRINVEFDSSYEIGTIARELRARYHQDRYLVLTGDVEGRGDLVLYLVVRHHNRELGVSQTRAVDVFRFDLVAGKMIYTTELDDHAFFIGQGSESFAIPVEQCGPGGLKSDSVYIADDLRVFDLKDGSITPILDTGDLSMTRFQSLWISPSTHLLIEELESQSKEC